jgi:hypothetical protein
VEEVAEVVAGEREAHPHREEEVEAD